MRMVKCKATYETIVADLEVEEHNLHDLFNKNDASYARIMAKRGTPSEILDIKNKPKAVEIAKFIVMTYLHMIISDIVKDGYTFAYFAGRAFGKRKIVPSISPNKTLEGFIGGFIGCVITGIVYAVISHIPVYIGAYVGIICGVLAPLGDLFESKLKRLCNVKDSGTLLPGHGGVLDRFDSLMFTAPVTLLLIL